MTLLPIVERELRLAARRGVTFWLRMVAALVAFVIAAGLFVLFSYVGGGLGNRSGGPLFAVLTWMSLAAALAAGLFFTADSLSEEKREGTLGFLFLTDLRGYDVVLGKLFATSCRCVFALLAIFPILAGTQLLGGVEVGQFWRTILALLHALFFSLAVGMFVSALSRHPQKALAGTFLLLLLLVGVVFAFDALRAHLSGASFQFQFSLVSPITLFLQANGFFAGFWTSFLIGQLTAWGLLGFACWLAPRNWQDRTRVSATSSPGRSWWRFGSEKQRVRLRAELLERNPTTWLACRERWQSRVVWALALVLVAEFIASIVLAETWINWVGMGIKVVVTLFLYLWMVSQACQFFAELRRAGLVELLLAAPLDFQKVALGAWWGLVRIFGLPIGIILVVQFLGEASGLNAMRFGGGVTIEVGSVSEWVQTWFAAGANLVTSLTNLIALSWFGLWMGLVSRNSLTGTLKTIAFVQIIPWLVLSYASALALPLMLLAFRFDLFATGDGTWHLLIVTGLMTLLSVAKDGVFFYLAWKKLRGNFRVTATRAVLPLNPMNLLPPVIMSVPGPAVKPGASG